VTLIEATPQILPRERPQAAAVVEAALRRDGVRIVCGARASTVESHGPEKIFRLECDGRRHEVQADSILVAVGRAPNVEGLALEAAGVGFDPVSGIVVNDFLQTSNPRIYAAGDICSRFKFTHAADAMARIVLQNALFLGRARVSALNIPWCTYPGEAEQRGLRTDAITVELGAVDRAILDGDEGGFLEVLLKKGTDRILGATLVARHAGDMISAITLAMTGGLGLRAFARTIHPYPTQAEVMKKAGDAFNRTRLTPRVKALFARILAWRR
jgi:pyruvate/2-oxoglutarate dehydrogenase complex dihydrolipoamide dehydrogenase (E3) component